MSNSSAEREVGPTGAEEPTSEQEVAPMKVSVTVQFDDTKNELRISLVGLPGDTAPILKAVRACSCLENSYVCEVSFETPGAEVIKRYTKKGNWPDVHIGDGIENKTKVPTKVNSLGQYLIQVPPIEQIVPPRFVLAVDVGRVQGRDEVITIWPEPAE